MGKLSCTCGHLIIDQSDSLPHKGWILKDTDHDTVYNSIADECEMFVNAVVDGKRDAWLQQYFRGANTRDASHSDVFFHFVSALLRKHLREMFECSECGRLWVQKPGCINEFVPFQPDSGQLEHVLRASPENDPGSHTG